MIHLPLGKFTNLSKDREKQHNLRKSVSLKLEYSNWNGKDYNHLTMFIKNNILKKF